MSNGSYECSTCGQNQNELTDNGHCTTPSCLGTMDTIRISIPHSVRQRQQSSRQRSASPNGRQSTTSDYRDRRPPQTRVDKRSKRTQSKSSQGSDSIQASVRSQIYQNGSTIASSQAQKLDSPMMSRRNFFIESSVNQQNIDNLNGNYGVKTPSQADPRLNHQQSESADGTHVQSRTLLHNNLYQNGHSHPDDESTHQYGNPNTEFCAKSFKDEVHPSMAQSSQSINNLPDINTSHSIRHASRTIHGGEHFMHHHPTIETPAKAKNLPSLHLQVSDNLMQSSKDSTYHESTNHNTMPRIKSSTALLVTNTEGFTHNKDVQQLKASGKEWKRYSGHDVWCFIHHLNHAARHCQPHLAADWRPYRQKSVSHFLGDSYSRILDRITSPPKNLVGYATLIQYHHDQISTQFRRYSEMRDELLLQRRAELASNCSKDHVLMWDKFAAITNNITLVSVKQLEFIYAKLLRVYVIYAINGSEDGPVVPKAEEGEIKADLKRNAWTDFEDEALSLLSECDMDSDHDIAYDLNPKAFDHLTTLNDKWARWTRIQRRYRGMEMSNYLSHRTSRYAHGSEYLKESFHICHNLMCSPSISRNQFGLWDIEFPQFS